MIKIPERGTIRLSTTELQSTADVSRSFATRDHDAIRRWAAQHRAEPATGEASASGPATIDVKDGGAGVRFNFPGAQRFRPISWDEWFANFDRHELVFMYDEDVADRAFELWQRRGGTHGRDLDDWLEAERLLRASGNPGSSRYRLGRYDTSGRRQEPEP